MAQPIAIVEPDYGVVGIGNTLKLARADARDWIGDPARHIPLQQDLSEHGLFAVRCTQSLAYAVRHFGGDVCYEIENEVIGLDGEFDH